MTGATIRRSLAILTAAATLALASPAFAQGGVRGKILDAQGNAVADATIMFQNVDNGAKPIETKSKKNGEYIQVGLFAGNYKVTVAKGDLSITKQMHIGLDMIVTDIKLEPSAGPKGGTKEEAAAAKAKAAAMNKSFSDGVELSNEGKLDESVAKFQEVATAVPNCVACYTNIGNVQGRIAAAAQDPADRTKKYADAEASFKMAIDKFDAADPTFKSNCDNVNTAANAYSGLASIYNATRKFDQAVDAQKKAGDMTSTGPCATGAAGAGGAPGAAGAPGTAAAPGSAGAPGAAAGAATPAGNANSVYNQGIILWNAGKIPEAKTQFEQAVKLDPNMAEAHYYLGMTLVNTGDLPNAKTQLETYLKLAPDGPNAPTAKAMLAQIK
ncbi:MAG TPA: tetratricopeptide repeat protein [Vicinamibacterales bacterium]